MKIAHTMSDKRELIKKNYNFHVKAYSTANYA